MDSNLSFPSRPMEPQDDNTGIDPATVCIDCLAVVSPDDRWYHWVVCSEAQVVLTPAPTVGARVTIGANGEEEKPMLPPAEVETGPVSSNPVSPNPELSFSEEGQSPPRNWVPRHLWDHQYFSRSVLLLHVISSEFERLIIL